MMQNSPTNCNALVIHIQIYDCLATEIKIYINEDHESHKCSIAGYAIEKV